MNALFLMGLIAWFKRSKERFSEIDRQERRISNKEAAYLNTRAKQPPTSINSMSVMQLKEETEKEKRAGEYEQRRFDYYMQRLKSH